MYTRAEITKVFRLSANESVMQHEFSMKHFYPNVCHICLSHDRETPLKRCKACKIISYCSKDHQKKHWPLHKDFCNAVSTLIMPGKSNIFEGAFSNLKIQNAVMVSSILRRELEHFELDMFVYTKVCEVCRNPDPDLLKACSKCPYANFCKQHEGDPKHEELCHLYTLCLRMDAYGLVFNTVQPEPADVIIKNTLPLKKLTRLPTSISEFMEAYFKLKKCIIIYSNAMRPFVKSHMNLDLLMKEEYFEGFFIHTSELFTRTLTLLYAMEKLNFPPNEKMVIHVIGANHLEIISLNEWELLLHWIPYLKNLKVVFVGPEVISQPKILPVVCRLCMMGNKKLSFEFHCLLYKAYVIESCLVMPDIVIGYNIGIANYKEWPDSIRIMKNFSCPLIITTDKELEAYQDQEVVNSILGAESCVFLEKNPFASLKPFRYADVRGGVCYTNINILIYNHFQKVSTKIKLPFMEAAKDSKDQDELPDLASGLPIKNFESALRLDP